MQKFIDMILIQMQSKRTWVSITSFVTLVGTLWFPEQLPKALGLVFVLQTWTLSDAQRPATSKFNTTSQTEQPFEVPKEVLEVLRQTMVKNAIGSIATEKAQTNHD